MRLLLLSWLALSAAQAKTPVASICVTSASGTWRNGAPIAFKPAAGPADVTVDPSKHYQKMLGFGAAVTDASAYLIGRMPPATRVKFIDDVFSPRGLGLSVARVPVGASDYSRSAYSYDDGPADPELSRFSIDHDRDYIIPALKAARAANPDLFLFSSPWSPPGWMKTSSSLLGGWMRTEYVDAYARYYLRFLEAYAAAGVRIDALTPQNEPETDQSGKMPATFLSPDQELAMVKQLGPMIRRAGLKTKIWIVDHNYDLWRRADYELNDPAAAPLIDGVAFHGYSGTPDMMSALEQAHPNVPIQWTEGFPPLGDGYGDWISWGVTISDVVENWASSFVAWNLLLDEQGKPNIGPFDCGGLITIDSKTGAFAYSGQYWAIGHFSRFVRRGAARVASSCAFPGLKQAAFLNPDGSVVLVLTNSGEARTLRVGCQGRTAVVSLPAKSITTLSWRG